MRPLAAGVERIKEEGGGRDERLLVQPLNK
jgi:hypothetical protein